MSLNINFKDNIKKIIKSIIFYQIKDYKEILKKINYFAPVLYEDYVLLKKQINDFRPKYLDWNYGSLENDFIKEDLEIKGNNILIGNSSSFENNHIEVIDYLSELDLDSRKIICPLSYGNSEYAVEIIKYGNKILPNNFEPLKNFMKIEEYNEIISTCSVVIMNHLRQQAVGNIIIMMYFGAKIFLNKENPVYEFFKNKGAIIFSINELNNQVINTKLSEEEIKKNRQILKEYWSEDIMIKKTEKLIETMRNC
jgi:hypothetical protein